MKVLKLKIKKFLFIFTISTILIYPQISKSDVTPIPSLPSQNTIASATPTSITTKQKIVDNDIVTWELEMAENGYAINKNVKNKARLLTVYEQVVALRCMPKLHESFTYTGNPSDSICLDYIQKTLALDAANPVALCARDGIDSDTCKEASQNQDLQTYDPRQEERTGVASLDDVISNRREAPAIAAETSKLSREIDDLKTNSARKKKPLDKIKVYNIFRRILTLNCKKSRIRLNEKDSEIAEAAKADATSKIASANSDEWTIKTPLPNLQAKQSRIPEDPFAAVLKGIEPKSAPTLPQSKRIYEIPEQCNLYIKRAQEIIPEMALPTCYRSGFYTYTCINAKRKEQKTDLSSTANRSSGKTNSSTGFDEF